jgi:flavin-dependent dehydrogenase
VVGADGPRTTVARAARLGRNREFLVGVEAEYVGIGGVAPDRLHCFLDSRIAPGYLAWIVPGVHGFQVGLACRPPHRPDLRRLVDRLARRFDFRRARATGRRGGLIPVGGPVRPLGGEGVVLVGDAAGLVSPLTAGGIHTALDSGRIAGAAVAAHLAGSGRAPFRVLQRAFPRRRVKGLLRRLMDLGLPDAAWDGLLTSPTFRALAATIFFHRRGLLSRAAIREVAAILLRAA